MGQVKELVISAEDAIIQVDPQDIIMSPFKQDFVRKPWGFYVDHVRTPGYVIKTLIVDPGKSLSVQRHQHRDEFWTVVHGHAFVSAGDSPDKMHGYSYKAGDQIVIIATEWHHVSNTSSVEPLVISEVQLGAKSSKTPKCIEVDIERY